MFRGMKYLKYHCFKRHGLISNRTDLNLYNSAHVKNLESEIDKLRTNLKEMSSTVQDKSQVKLNFIFLFFVVLK